jgi:splicing factor 3B subunit 2
MLANATEGKVEDEAEKQEDPEVKDMFSAKNSGMVKNKDEAMTRKQRKLAKQMKVFDLKMQVERPDLVEAWDVTAKDPVFLVQCKQLRNTVPVSPHWSQKRRYLQYKRGIHKIAFKLPEFIENTGITKLRDKASAHDASKTLKQRMRERMQPKMGKIDIDYQILHDAFFKHQKKSRMSDHGDVYYEGKEYEINTRVYKPGMISPALQAALGIQENCPPPWLYNMQRYGPPPSYPNLKIPGVNMILPTEISTLSVGRIFTNEKGYTIYADCHGLNKAVY